MTAARVLGVVAVVAAIVAGNWLTSDPQFALDEGRVEVSGLVHTDPDVVWDRLGLVPGDSPNLFELRTSAMERALVALPAVDRAEVRAVLPDSLVVAIIERSPVFVWRVGGDAFLVDATGVLIGAAGRDDEGPVEGALPVVDDRRLPTEPPMPGATMNEIDLGAILRLAALSPDLLGSAAERLELSIETEDGFVVHAVPGGWRAVFGHYTPTLRTTDLIERQVQCLRSILAEGEGGVETVYLSLGDDRCGTFVPGSPSDQPSRSAEPSRRGDPSRSDDPSTPSEQPPTEDD